MNRFIILILLVSACTEPSMDGVYVIDKEKLKNNITNAKNYVADSESERMLKDIDNNELVLIIGNDSAQIISSGQTSDLNDVRYKFTSTQSGIKFTTKDSEVVFEKTDTCYLLSVPGMMFSPPQRVEFLKLDAKEADEYLATLASETDVHSSVTPDEPSDFRAWNGRFFNFEGSGIRLEGNGNTLKAFDVDDNAPLEVELLPDGRVLIDGAEAYVSNDTLSLVISGSGGSSESVYVKTLNDMN